MSDHYTAEYVTKFRMAELNAAAEHRRLARDLRLTQGEQMGPRRVPWWWNRLRHSLPSIHLPHLHVGH